MSVVPSDFEELKRYNIAEIFDPSPKEQPKKEAAKEDVTEAGEKVPEETAEVVPVAEESAKVEDAAKDVSVVEEPAKVEEISQLLAILLEQDEPSGEAGEEE